MANDKLPAYPNIYEFSPRWNNETINESGFTKLELASLMIAQGNMAEGGVIGSDQIWAARMVTLAKAILEEANK